MRNVCTLHEELAETIRAMIRDWPFKPGGIKREAAVCFDSVSGVDSQISNLSAQLRSLILSLGQLEPVGLPDVMDFLGPLPCLDSIDLMS